MPKMSIRPTRTEDNLPNASFHLFQLQKVDSRLLQIDQRFVQIETDLANNPELVAIREKLENANHALAAKEETMKGLEKNIQTKRIKMQQSESSLYSGKNSNPKELNDLQTEIESLKKGIVTIEEQQFSLLNEIEMITQDVTNIQIEHDLIVQKTNILSHDLLVEKDSLLAEKEKLHKEKTVILSQIPENLVKQYQVLANEKNHVAVALVDEDCCSICGAEITPRDIQKVRASISLINCPSCGRILYAG
jgi:predicted  nucleic acid-binding Zn-ribbon protein